MNRNGKAFMKDTIEIQVIIDEQFVDPKVKIYTKGETEQVENIIYAIENMTKINYAPIPAYQDVWI